MPVYRSALLKANNLSDVPTPSTARSNIGLGSSATHPTGDFAQTANNLSDVTAATARNNLAAAQRLAATPVKTSNYTAVIGDLVLCDATAGGFAVTLPTTPVVGAKVNVKKLDATTNAVTVTCGGSDLIITGVSTTSATASLAVAEAREFAFDGTSRWIVAVGQTPQSTLDARYAQVANNLSDVTAATARTNLGLGSAATHPASDFGDTSSNTAASVDSEIVLFSSTTGKLLKRATGSGIPLLTSGVLGLATLGTDYGKTQVDSYTPGSYTWTEPAGAKAVDVTLIAGGGGGGAGRRGAAASVRCGGGGGGAGGVTTATLAPSGAGTVVTVVVGAAGTAAAAQTVDSTDGATGGTGGDTTLTQAAAIFVQARGGTAGGGGTNAAGAAGIGGGGTSIGSNGAAASGTGGAGATGAIGPAGGGGGAGGGVTSADVAAGGGGGGPCLVLSGAGGAAGGANASGSAGHTGARNGVPGGGGGGGGGSITGAGGTGGAGVLGGGGGGGGASLNGNNSGAGGAGGGGFVQIVTRF